MGSLKLVGHTIYRQSETAEPVPHTPTTSAQPSSILSAVGNESAPAPAQPEYNNTLQAWYPIRPQVPGNGQYQAGWGRVGLLRPFWDGASSHHGALVDVKALWVGKLGFKKGTLDTIVFTSAEDGRVIRDKEVFFGVASRDRNRARLQSISMYYAVEDDQDDVVGTAVMASRPQEDVKDCWNSRP